MTQHKTTELPVREGSSEPESAAADWGSTVRQYKQPNPLKSCWQVANTVLPFAAIWYLMLLSSSWSYVLMLLLAVPAAGLLVRVFIIQHDCGHHSFFRSHRVNDWLGSLCGILTLTPYHLWRRTHARHHVTSGNLDHRGHGDIYTLTVREYQKKSRFGRLSYRVYRNPFFMFFIGASFMFLVQQRSTRGIPHNWRRERKSVYFTNFGIVGVLLVAHLTIGLPTFLLIQLPIVIFASAVGSWLFFVQHQFEDAYWDSHEAWDFTRAALEGSSFYRLPSVLRWFSGNIGYHHIHHLNSRIPNYNLPACHAAEEAFREAPTFGVRESIRLASLKLWDEDAGRMVTFAEAG